MRSVLVLIGFCALALVIATSQGMSGQFCLGQNHGCLLVNADGIHLVDNKALAKYDKPTVP